MRLTFLEVVNWRQEIGMTRKRVSIWSQHKLANSLFFCLLISMAFLLTMTQYMHGDVGIWYPKIHSFLKQVNLVRFVGLLRGCVWSEFDLCFVTVTWEASKYFGGEKLCSVWSVKWGVWTCSNAIRLHGMRSHVTPILGRLIIIKNLIFL